MQTFLILEDEPLIAMDLKMAFEDAGYAAVTTIDNSEAISCIEQSNIEGAILDVSLGGGETCRKTADCLSERKIPFILHTGDLDRVGESLRAIDAPVIAKPRPADDVIAALLTLLGSTKPPVETH
ncbi:Response regulator receiver domain-containing protein [Altererythrobacter xiamenensis]|uniref:Response regulator receiver domain-containing protein n=1 Tax=Altererythrobacter xiamenensis TaxID=1316679 RepID=A0A1Y6FII9_9SPHN|nr:response regulator [Altererythrobacter xiamenensis]SMQ74655.1 Response regulator receiver domain-containing protein [Altererythrobacter xiamenensis]